MNNFPTWRMYVPRVRMSADTPVGSMDWATSSERKASAPSTDSEAASTQVASSSRVKRNIESIAAHLNVRQRAEIVNRETGARPLLHDWSADVLKSQNGHPDIIAMCNAVRQKLLIDPSQNLPASFNGPLLHIIEAYEDLLRDNTAKRATNGHGPTEPEADSDRPNDARPRARARAYERKREFTVKAKNHNAHSQNPFLESDIYSDFSTDKDTDADSADFDFLGRPTPDSLASFQSKDKRT